MNRYDTPTPRAALTIAALALTVLTLGLSVVLPVHAGGDAPTLRVRTAVPAATEVAIIPGRIEVIGTRHPRVASVASEDTAAACSDEG